MRFAFSPRLCNVDVSMSFAPFKLAQVLLVSLLCCAGCLAADGTNNASDTNASATDMGPVAATVARMLELYHYLHPLSLSEKNPPHLESDPAESMVDRVLDNYLQVLDYNRLYFTAT